MRLARHVGDSIEVSADRSQRRWRYRIHRVRIARVFRIGLVSLTLGLAALSGPTTASAAPSDLDPSFDGDGYVSLDLGGQDVVYGIAIQPDGKVIAVGQTGSGSDIDFGVGRFSTNGSLDGGFGAGGLKVIDFAGGVDAASCVTLQADGKIVVAGHAFIGGSARFATVRLYADGSLDGGFGSGGKVTTDFGGWDIVQAVAVQPDGKILVAGEADAGTPDFGLVRYNPDGSLDSSFGAGGKVTTHINGPDTATSLALQADGKIIVAGSSGPAFITDFALARYNPNGSLDSGFGIGGIVTTDFGSFDIGRAMALQADGRIVVAGDSGWNASNFALARYHSDGSLDSSFGTGGKVTTDFGHGDHGHALVIQANGKIVVAGYQAYLNGTGADFALARYLGDGSLDPTFDDDGRVVTSFTPHDTAWALKLQPDGKLIAGGYLNGTGALDWALARYLGDPVVVDADNDGVADTDDAFPFDPAEWLDTDGDGTGNNADVDDDNDGQADADELACGSDPLLATSLSPDNDGDNAPDCADPDDDNDGVADGADNCPLTANADQANDDGDGSGDVCDTDDDNDGVADAEDAYPYSDTAAMVVIDGCETGVGNHLFADGSTFNDLIGTCSLNATNHGAFVSCVTQLANTWRDAGLISGAQKGRITSCAARADIP